MALSHDCSWELASIVTLEAAIARLIFMKRRVCGANTRKMLWVTLTCEMQALIVAQLTSQVR